MAQKQALILHIAGVGEPVRIALTDEVAADLGPRLRRHLETASTQAVPTEDGGEFVVNFAQVATAHIGPVNAPGGLYGKAPVAASRETALTP
ncbi:hypothetical protein [Crossiella cryophila]|uniref:Uncharacterized protein n=1 Tax=Crossiella cryophila TaxID=43355 RepID=A0A7W7C8F4_9PSEU|nr:hypothetical protein [Crossiella cryophila]MBB4675124.1 hypothetical protein [Crossiella cryophila]